MATTVTRLTNSGTFLVNGSFDEITTSSIRVTTDTVFASTLDEVSGMGVQTNLLTYIDAGKIESYNFNYDRQRLVDLSTSSRIVMQNTATWVSTFSGGLSYPVIPGTVSGTEPWVQLQDSVLNNRSSGTISAWIQYTAFSRSGDYHDNYGQAIVSRQRDSVGTWGHLAVSGYVNSSGAPLLGTTGKIYWHPRNGIAPANSTANLAYNTVYHIAVTFNTTECRFYINGVLDSTTAGDYSIPSSQESTYGTAVAVWRYGGEYYMPWSGYIYGMKFYNSVLSADQVAQNYNADAARFALAPITAPPVHRQSSTGTLLVTGLFDEFTGAPVVDSSLVLWLDAGQPASYPGSGTTWTDLSNSGRTTTLSNGPAYISQAGGQIVLDGTDDYANFSSLSPMAGTNLFTYEIWVNFTTISGAFGGTNKAAFLFCGGTGSGTGQPEFYILSANNSSTTPSTLNFGRGAGGTTGSLSIDVSALIANGNWYQIVLVRTDSASQIVYLNGVQIGTGTVSNSFLDGQTDIGGLHGNVGYPGWLNGKISNVKIYNRVLSADEVTTNFNANRRRYGI
jgi:hypothetical protein